MRQRDERLSHERLGTEDSLILSRLPLMSSVLSPDSLVQYFQSIHNNDIFEVRGVQIENIQNRMVSQNSLNETINFNLSCAVALYSLCYSIMKPCNYWNYNPSLPTILDKGKKMCRKSSLEHNQQSPCRVPEPSPCLLKYRFGVRCDQPHNF